MGDYFVMISLQHILYVEMVYEALCKSKIVTFDQTCAFPVFYGQILPGKTFKNCCNTSQSAFVFLGHQANANNMEIDMNRGITEIFPSVVYFRL